ncbi:MAG: hypothetical protein A2826_01535 [Candidatus Doudnabacteria bacterium RIFCSPHIGHO2_01_FULL_43_23]|uniref:N-acetyltransferase domain-containing protein n=1 Tax=Candidatus Doudnabacteria bacterium RIFCSPHIGHO2_01_FULL_43_23 TaxID=1817822 RepID=A0A1F5NVG4_9BACT|nr:MAG: hypothetical protein A2826_01535 [Candidatus Doudnabacteria bacterium RIFCSPHIGHO2_01_FULL_43_23]
MKTRIRKAKKSDYPKIKKLVSDYPGKLIVELLPEVNDFFVAEAGGEIVGCCALEVYSKRLAQVRSLAVAASHHGKGIGSSLVTRCVLLARKKKIEELLAITSADKFFYKNGFRLYKRGRIPMYLKPNAKRK